MPGSSNPQQILANIAKAKNKAEDAVVATMNLGKTVFE